MATYIDSTNKLILGTNSFGAHTQNPKLTGVLTTQGAA